MHSQEEAQTQIISIPNISSIETIENRIVAEYCSQMKSASAMQDVVTDRLVALNTNNIDQEQLLARIVASNTIDQEKLLAGVAASTTIKIEELVKADANEIFNMVQAIKQINVNKAVTSQEMPREAGQDDNKDISVSTWKSKDEAAARLDIIDRQITHSPERCDQTRVMSMGICEEIARHRKLLQRVSPIRSQAYNQSIIDLDTKFNRLEDHARSLLLHSCHKVAPSASGKNKRSDENDERDEHEQSSFKKFAQSNSLLDGKCASEEQELLGQDNSLDERLSLDNHSAEPTIARTPATSNGVVQIDTNQNGVFVPWSRATLMPKSQLNLPKQPRISLSKYSQFKTCVPRTRDTLVSGNPMMIKRTFSAITT